ncbi:hypothetical protein ANACAC_03453 [Anaerostipes caccae L1-92]|uniref:Uncharacterized protein n=1 Tax=Anaerostipes caccae (strain DSM 14662 / CCUG 47493 / JCM 13470 / NCIMB 13811 / L1-92) TaxID=411490 RepID=B0MIJ7_ANACD|nr:hypothetical protein ANACAC_03453 [Anaerostipes caccae L1-92]
MKFSYATILLCHIYLITRCAKEKGICAFLGFAKQGLIVYNTHVYYKEI